MENISYKNSITLPFNIYYIEPYTQLRRAKILILSDILRKYKEFNNISIENQHKIFQIIENSCYNSAIEKAEDFNEISNFNNLIFCDIYNDICGNLFSNLDINSLVKSNYLINKILNNEINYINLGNLTSQDMCPEKYTELLKLIQLKNNIQHTIKYSNIDKCRKCGESKCGMQRMQTRSLDEGTCYRYTCLNCGNTWMKG
jgi:DNA-directed RNA polymerase subunit M/transcription elongation factor TFIIS